MSSKEKLLNRLREIGALLDGDLDWVDPQRRDAFAEQLKRERDEFLDILLQETPEPADRRGVRYVLQHLRRNPDDAAKAASLDAWIARA